jgi:hypothetical protein
MAPYDFPEVAPPVPHLGSARYFGASSAPPVADSSAPSGWLEDGRPALPPWRWGSPVPLSEYQKQPWTLPGPPMPGPDWLKTAQSPSPLSNDALDAHYRTVNNDSRVISDVTPDNEWIPGAQYAGQGHHYASQKIWRKLPLPKETQRVFDKATTGQLPFFKWHVNDTLHRMYSDAVDEIFTRFMHEHNIKPEKMTPDQARSILREIAVSEDPRIRAYNLMLRRMRMLHRLRTGIRGSD